MVLVTSKLLSIANEAAIPFNVICNNFKSLKLPSQLEHILVKFEYL